MSFYRRTDVTLERLQIRVEVPGLTASFGSDVDSVTTSESEAESVDMVGEQADDLLRSMTRTFQRQVQRHRTQRHPTGALTDGEVVELLTETDVQLEQSRAEHTWEGYASVIHQFRFVRSEATQSGMARVCHGKQNSCLDVGFSAPDLLRLF